MASLRIGTLALAATLIATSCAPANSATPPPGSPAASGGPIATEEPSSAAEDGDRHPFLGALPRPMPLAPPPTTDSEANARFLQLVALTTAVRKGGPDALAAWETLLVAIGNPVVDESGSAIEINGHAGTGYAVMPAQLRWTWSRSSTAYTRSRRCARS